MPSADPFGTTGAGGGGSAWPPTGDPRPPTPGRSNAIKQFVTSNMAAVAVLSGLLLIGLVLVTRSGGGSSSASEGGGDDGVPRLEAAHDSCIAEQGIGTVEVLDGGRGMSIDTGEYGSYDAAECIWNELGTSQSTRTAISNTNALAGVRTATEDGLSYEWTYHPDDGMEMIIRDSGE